QTHPRLPLLHRQLQLQRRRPSRRATRTNHNESELTIGSQLNEEKELYEEAGLVSRTGNIFRGTYVDFRLCNVAARGQGCSGIRSRHYGNHQAGGHCASPAAYRYVEGAGMRRGAQGEPGYNRKRGRWVWRWFEERRGLHFRGTERIGGK